MQHIHNQSPSDAVDIHATRLTMLKELLPLISKKLLFSLEEKLALEKEQLESFSGMTRKEQATRNLYSFVLDSQYFEQELLND